LQMTCRDGRVSLHTATRLLVEGTSAKGLEIHHAL
jgi:hypothetical protein